MNITCLESIDWSRNLGILDFLPGKNLPVILEVVL